MNDPEITALITNLSRPHPSGGVVIERAAILAAGAESSEIIDWIIAHSGTPETPVFRGRGLHGVGVNSDGDRVSTHPTRFILPAGALH